ncbi:MAG: hypothetical protein AAF213_07850 [Pseudomonadota bacterium]
MYPVLISMVITLLVLAMIPRDKPAFDPLAFMNPPAAASTAEAEVHAHNLSVFAEAVMQRLVEDPDSLPRYPDRIRVDQLESGRGTDPVLPGSYRYTMPWEAILLPLDDENQGVAGVGAIVAFITPANLTRGVKPVDLARGLKLTAGDEVPVGLIRDGQLLSDGFINPQVAKGFGAVRNLPAVADLTNAPAIVVCLNQRFCARG